MQNEEKIEYSVFSIRIPTELKESLEREAKRRKRSRNFIVEEKLTKAYEKNSKKR